MFSTLTFKIYNKKELVLKQFSKVCSKSCFVCSILFLTRSLQKTTILVFGNRYLSAENENSRFAVAFFHGASFSIVFYLESTLTDSAVSTDPGNTEKEPPAKKTRKKVESSRRKTRPDFHMKRGSESNIDEMVQKIKEQFRRKSPVEVFDDEIRKHIVQQSTIYASQKNRHNFVFSDNCLKKLIGFLLLTGNHGLPQEKMYWCEDENVESDIVWACFSRNRYLEIKRNLHFNDNSTLGTGEHAKSFRIAPLIEKMNEKFLMYGVFSKHLSIDEQMVQYYGRHFMKQFSREKPIQFGYKNWAMCCSDSILTCMKGKKP